MASIEKQNAERRNVELRTRDSLERILPLSRPHDDAAVTCGRPEQRSAVFYHVLYRAVSAGMPAVVLYSTEETERQLRRNPDTVFLRPDRQRYMPLLGMTPQEALSALSPVDGDAPWAIGESEALQLYLDLLPRLGLPVSLRHLSWLVQLERESFTAFVNASRLRETERQGIIRRTAAYYGGAQPLIHNLRSRADALGLAASCESLYDPYGTDTNCSSILTAIRSSSVLAIRLNADAPSRRCMNLLSQEMSIARNEGDRFLLACCDLIIPEESRLAGQLQIADGRMTTFLSAAHGPNAFPSNRSDYWQGMLRGSLLVLNCGSAGTGASYEELFGNYQRIKTTRTRTYSRQAFSIRGTFGNATITAEETIPRIRQQTLNGNPRGGVFRPEDGSDRIYVIGDLGL